MVLPTQSQLHIPILETLNGLEDDAHVRIIKETLAERFSMIAAELAELVPSGQVTRFDDRSKWALSYLKRAGLIHSPSRSHWKIAPEGRDFLSTHKGGDVSGGQLNKLIEKRKREASHDGGGARVANVGESESAGFVHDEPMDIAYRKRMDEIHMELERALADELLDSVKAVSPLRFERLVVDLLETMGYGEGRRIGGGGQGIDGVINQDPLGLEKVYIQAKRRQNAVGEAEIRNFLGSMDMKGASKGVFIATSTFGESAKSSAFAVRRTIRLVDGGELAELMIRHNVGVVTETVYALKKPDENYFSEDA